MKETPSDPPNSAPAPRKPPAPPEPPLPGADELGDFDILVGDYSIRGRLQRWLTNWRIVLVILAAAVTLVWIFAGPRLYRSAKAWRAQHFLEEAQRAQAAGDGEKALSSLRSATLMAPYDPRVARAMTHFRAKQGDPGAFPSLKQLVDAGQATPDELLVFAKGMLWGGLHDEAKSALSRLPPSLTEPQTNLRSLLEIELAAQGSLGAAIELARKRAEKVSGEAADDLRLLQARLLLRAAESGGNADAKTEALALLESVGSAATRSGLEALRLRAALALNAKSAPDALAGELRAHPRHTPDDLLLAASLDLVSRPADEKQIIDALKDARATAPDAEQLAFARWLNRRGAFEDVLAIAGDERIRTKEDWLLVALDALAGLGRWQEVRELVEQAESGVLDEPIRHLFLARASMELGDTAAAEQSWLDVHRHARLGKPENLAYVARYAEQIGAYAEAAKAYRRLSERKETALNGFLGLLRCQPRNAPAAELLPIYQEFLEQFPHLAEVKNDAAYLSLLCNRDIEQSAATAHALRAKYPAMLSFITTAALGELRLGNPAKADALYASQQIDWTDAPAPFKAVRVASLHAAGRETEAEALRETIAAESLRPEERGLLTPGAGVSRSDRTRDAIADDPDTPR